MDFGYTTFFWEDRMNQTCSINKSLYEDTILPGIYIFAFFVALGTNGCGLKSLLHNWKKVGNINVFVLNLGLGNLLFLPALPFLAVYYLKNRDWIFGDAFCKITRFCFNLNLYGSIGFLTCISVYRYLAIVHPMRAMGRLTVINSAAISVTVWLLVSVQSLPDMFYAKTTYKNNTKTKCYHTTSNYYVKDYLKYSLGWTVTGFVIPLLITLCCYGRVIVVLCRTNTIEKVLRQRCLKLLFILILLFSVCYIPYHALKNLTLYSRLLAKKKACLTWENGVFGAHQISRGLVCLNSALNPLVYLHVTDNIPAQLRRLLQRARQMFNCQCTSNSGRLPVAQSVDEV